MTDDWQTNLAMKLRRLRAQTRNPETVELVDAVCEVIGRRPRPKGRPRLPPGQALSNAERQRRWRARHKAVPQARDT